MRSFLIIRLLLRCLFNKVIPIFAVLILLSSCMVGPNFRSPTAPAVASYTRTPLPNKTVKTATSGKSGKTQYFMNDKDIPLEWWTLFHSPELNQLIQMGLANSPTLIAAKATLRQSQETYKAQIGTLLFPSISGQLNAQRQLFSGDSIGEETPSSLFNLYNASVAISYTLDLFGGARRQIEGYAAQVDYQQFQLVAAYLSLTANIVTAAIATASLDAQLKATHELLSKQEHQLSIMRKQFRYGGISRVDVLSQATLTAQTRAIIPALEKNLAQSQHALAILVGEFPNRPLPIVHLENLDLPTHLPVSLPSTLVKQRPDVRAAEALLHVASAQVGVATANLFPQITLTGNYGWTSLVPSGLFQSNNKTWTIGGQFSQPIFNGGSLRAERRAAMAAYDQAAAQYRQVVLQAFKNVADTLRALEEDAKTLRAQKEAETDAYQSQILSQDQYRLGGTNYISLLNAQQQYLQTKINRIQAQATRFSDTAALFQALGGGWWHEEKKCAI